MFTFGLKMGRGKELDPPYLDKIIIQVRGKISSYNRGGQFQMYPTAGGAALVEGVDFHLTEKNGIAYSDANLKLFLDGNNPSADIVAVNGNGYMELTFAPETVYSMDNITIQGRTTAGSTQFGMTILDNHGHTLWTKGITTVTNMVTWNVGIDL